ncbi:MAG TPA: hypothetical protein VGL53_26640 [Bryobacteraceae bacterium]
MLRRLSIALLVACAIALPTLAAEDVTGKWTFNVETDAGSGSPTFIFKQSGEALTGTYSGAFGEAPINGMVKGDSIEFTFKASSDGQEVTCKYRGKITGNQIKGNVDLGSVGTGTFTATKQ